MIFGTVFSQTIDLLGFFHKIIFQLKESEQKNKSYQMSSIYEKKMSC